MKRKAFAGWCVLVILSLPAFVTAGPVPDTGQETCYDAIESMGKNCPEYCDGGCQREFVDPDDAEKTIKDYYYNDGTSCTKYAYYGFSKCYDSGVKDCEVSDLTCTEGVVDEAGSCPDTCYRDRNCEERVDCPSDLGTGTDAFLGQDGNYTTNPPSYTGLDGENTATDVTDDLIMVRDEKTGLTWLIKESSGTSVNVASKTYNHSDSTEKFIGFVNSTGAADLGFGGHDDWRLPTIKELSSFVNSENVDPAVDASNYFLNMQSGHYWSSTSVAGEGADAGNIFYVDFTDGSIGSDSADTENYVIAVREPNLATAKAERFKTVGDTIVDTESGLMWQKTSAFEGDWEEALFFCEQDTFGDYTDWRMPNRKELQSLIDYAKTSAPLADTGEDKFGIDPVSYWTSTTFVQDPTNAWTVNFENGHIEGKNKVTDKCKVLAVRGSQNEDPDLVWITEPTMTSAWMLGRMMPIIWGNTAKIKGNVNISVSTDAGASWTPIVENTANDGSYVWREIGKNDKGEDMGLPEDELFMVKVEAVDDSGGENVQGLFSIGPDTGTVSVEWTLEKIIYGLQVLTGQVTE